MSDGPERVGMPPLCAAVTRGFLGNDAVDRMDWTRTETWETTTLPTRIRRQPLMAAVCLLGMGVGVVGARTFESAFARAAVAIVFPSYFLYRAHRYYDLFHWKTTRCTDVSILGQGKEPSSPAFALSGWTNVAWAIPTCPYGSWAHCWKRVDDQPIQEPEKLTYLSLLIPEECSIPDVFNEGAIPTSLLPQSDEKVQLWCSWGEEEQVLVNLSLNAIEELD